MCVRHEPLWPNSTRLRINLLAGSAEILCTGRLDVIRKEAWPFFRAISGVRLYRVLEESKAPKGSTEQFPVSTYVGSSKNLKDLKDLVSRFYEISERLEFRRFGPS